MDNIKLLEILSKQSDEFILDCFFEFLESDCPLMWTGSENTFPYHKKVPIKNWSYKRDYFPCDFKVVRDINLNRKRFKINIRPSKDVYGKEMNEYSYDANKNEDEVPYHKIATAEIKNDIFGDINLTWLTLSLFLVRHFHYDNEGNWKYFTNIFIKNLRNNLITDIIK